MPIPQFIQQDNINMIWEVISDEKIFQFLTRDIQNKIYNLFLNNIQGFFENERNKTNSLVEMNKKYILLILNHIRKNYPIEPHKIKIYNEPVKELITFEEISNDRKSQFEKDLIKKQEEFEDSMSLKTPPVPEFSDKHTDRPIKGMDKILKEMQAQRNYEVEQINRKYNNDTTQVDNWLKPQETSLKNEKLVQKVENEVLQNSSRFKYLNELNINNNNNNNKKNVSWGDTTIDNIESEDNYDEENDNIFSKLKKVEKKDDDNIKLIINEPNLNNSINKNIEERIIIIENNYKNINSKIDKILDLLGNSIKINNM